MTERAEAGAAASWHELWQAVGEGLLGGVQHALNNRIAALSAVAQVLGAGMTDAQPLVASLAGEVRRLQETVALLSLLRRAKARNAEPIQLPELLSRLAELLPHHADLKEIAYEVEEDPGLLPLWAERDQLTRVFLVLMTAAGFAAEHAGGSTVRVRFSGEESHLTVRVEGDGAEGRERLDVRAAAAPLAEMGGELAIREEGGVVGYEVRLPTLLEVRRRERSAAPS